MPQKYTILVTDSEPLLGLAIEQALVGAPYEVVRAGNGAEVLLRAHTCQPDLIVLRLEMPVLDGIKTLGLLREDPVTREIPVVMVDDAVEDSTVARALGAGAAFYLTKPLELEEVRAIIGRLLSI